MTAVHLGLLLEASRVAEVPSYWPWVAGRRVLRVLRVLPVIYAGDPFHPRRAQ